MSDFNGDSSSEQRYCYTFGGITFEVWPSLDDGWVWSCDELDEEEAGFLTHAEARRAAEKRARLEAGCAS